MEGTKEQGAIALEVDEDLIYTVPSSPSFTSTDTPEPIRYMYDVHMRVAFGHNATDDNAGSMEKDIQQLTTSMDRKMSEVATLLNTVSRAMRNGFSLRHYHYPQRLSTGSLSGQVDESRACRDDLYTLSSSRRELAEYLSCVGQFEAAFQLLHDVYCFVQEGAGVRKGYHNIVFDLAHNAQSERQRQIAVDLLWRQLQSFQDSEGQVKSGPMTQNKDSWKENARVRFVCHVHLAFLLKQLWSPAPDSREIRYHICSAKELRGHAIDGTPLDFWTCLYGLDLRLDRSRNILQNLAPVHCRHDLVQDITSCLHWATSQLSRLKSIDKSLVFQGRFPSPSEESSNKNRDLLHWESTVVLFNGLCAMAGLNGSAESYLLPLQPGAPVWRYAHLPQLSTTRFLFAVCAMVLTYLNDWTASWESEWKLTGSSNPFNNRFESICTAMGRLAALNEEKVLIMFQDELVGCVSVPEPWIASKRSTIVGDMDPAREMDHTTRGDIVLDARTADAAPVKSSIIRAIHEGWDVQQVDEMRRINVPWAPSLSSSDYSSFRLPSQKIKPGTLGRPVEGRQTSGSLPGRDTDEVAMPAFGLPEAMSDISEDLEAMKF